MLAAYGEVVLHLPFEKYYQLLLNLPRVILRQATAVAQGEYASSTNENLGREWADALATCEEEVDEIEYQMRESRREARAAAKRGW